MTLTDDTEIRLSDPERGFTESITIGELKEYLGVNAPPPATAYGSNAEAVAALGVGKLYKSQALSVNGSPYILITV